MSKKIEEAILFATDAHKGQVRKYTGEPYVFHCFDVARMVKEHGGTDEMVMAAILHDTVEDTETSLSVIRLSFGETVAKYVEGLTDISKPEDGNRKVRKEIDKLHTAEQCKEVQTIKVFDLISNTRSIKKHDHGFWKTYSKEKLALLDVMTKVDASLLSMARMYVEVV